MNRFWSKVDKNGLDDCWVWMACKNADGYGRVMFRGETTNAHRVAFELINGPIPKDKILHHKCINPSCVNPNHLELTTRASHPDSHSSILKKRTHCKYGHQFLPSTTYIGTNLAGNKFRTCAICLRFYNQYHRLLKRMTQWR